MGSNRFRIDIPLYLEFYRRGDSCSTRWSAAGRLDDIKRRVQANEAGEVARSVLTFD